jgi:hypothetical protein
MSYEDIEEARKKRTAKDVTKGKGQRGRKSKSAILEADEPDPDHLEADEEETGPEPEVARPAKEVTKGKGKRGRKRKSATFEADELEVEQEVAEMIEEPEQEVAQTIKAREPWKALVARMY